MPRIRSVHPGLFTDEAFVAMSDAAQIFLVGLWTEADDQGVFEWKPVTLKMRLRPASVEPVEPLLTELEGGNWIARFDYGGRQYGALRNFRKFQRPKKPNRVHVLPARFRTYVGLDGRSSELDDDDTPEVRDPAVGDAAPPPQPSSTGGGKAQQMEDGGEERREKKGEEGAGARASAPAAEYAWQGRVIRIRQDVYNQWQKSYSRIPDLDAALQSCDDYLIENPPKDGKWFFAASSWLKRENEHATKRGGGAKDPLPEWARV